jgi:hypothetical protein
MDRTKEDDGVKPLVLQAATKEVIFFNEEPLPISPVTFQMEGSIVVCKEKEEEEEEETTPINNNENDNESSLVKQIDSLNNQNIRQNIKNSKSKKKVKIKKQVRFPENIIKDYSLPPKKGWIPGFYSTNDLVDAYIKSCQQHKCRQLVKLMPQLKALQDLDCSNGEKVNVLNLKSKTFFVYNKDIYYKVMINFNFNKMKNWIAVKWKH